MRRYTIYEETSTIRKKDFNPDMSFVEFIWMNSSPDMVYVSACREEAMKEFERLNKEAGVTHDNTDGSVMVTAYWLDEEELDEDGEWCFYERWDSTDLYEKYKEWQTEQERDDWNVECGEHTDRWAVYGIPEEAMDKVDKMQYTGQDLTITSCRYGEEFVKEWLEDEQKYDDWKDGYGEYVRR